MKAGWKTKTLGDVAEVIAGQSPEGSFYNNSGDGLPFYQGKKEFEERFIRPPTTWTSRITKVALEGDVLISVRAPVGPVNFATEKSCIGRGLAAIRSGGSLDRNFLFYFLLSEQDEISGTEGAVFASINKAEIQKIKIVVPPLPEQQRIVRLLDEAFEGIATAKANTEKNLQNASALFESHLQSVFTQRSEGWVEMTLDKLSTNLDSKRVPITKSDRTSGDYPYYGASGIVDYVADYIFEGDTLLVSEDGANLLARSTPIAFSVSGKYWVNNHAHILKFVNMATQRFVEFHLESIKLDEYIRGAAQPKLTQAALNSIPIPIPKSVEEQAKIVESIQTLSEETQRLESIYQKKLAALEALKKSLLNQAFNGEL
ncbi:MAG: restriction endonuclease subunit S [Desulfobacterales bacterium]|nr:restriction endonuclease subunit S [Desulfobacterales bacterium]